jgi:hypothetical protein
MTHIDVTWIAEPNLIANALDEHDIIWRQFFDTLGERLGITITKTIGNLVEVAPERGFVVMTTPFRHPTLDHDLRSRTIPIGESRPKILQRVLEPYQLPAAIDSMSVSEWRSDAERMVKGAKGLWGRHEIAEKIGARCSTIFLFRSEHYAYLSSDHHDGLPHLLADYLRALAPAG